MRRRSEPMATVGKSIERPHSRQLELSMIAVRSRTMRLTDTLNVELVLGEEQVARRLRLLSAADEKRHAVSHVERESDEKRVVCAE